jgi:hypothetical protein
VLPGTLIRQVVAVPAAEVAGPGQPGRGPWSVNAQPIMPATKPGIAPATAPAKQIPLNLFQSKEPFQSRGPPSTPQITAATRVPSNRPEAAPSPRRARSAINGRRPAGPRSRAARNPARPPVSRPSRAVVPTMRDSCRRSWASASCQVERHEREVGVRPGPAAGLGKSDLCRSPALGRAGVGTPSNTRTGSTACSSRRSRMTGSPGCGLPGRQVHGDIPLSRVRATCCSRRSILVPIGKDCTQRRTLVRLEPPKEIN